MFFHIFFQILYVLLRSLWYRHATNKKKFLMPYALLKAFLKRLNKIFLLHNITVVVQLHVAIKVFHFFAPHLCIIK